MVSELEKLKKEKLALEREYKRREDKEREKREIKRLKSEIRGKRAGLKYGKSLKVAKGAGKFVASTVKASAKLSKKALDSIERNARKQAEIYEKQGRPTAKSLF